MSMRKFYVLALLGIGALVLAGCDGGTLGGNPEIVSKTATNSGADLQIVWKSVENAEEYRV
ncbi:MAG: hypothetical protein ABIL41_04970, partial [candidate division WOR-3 bacterium]